MLESNRFTEEFCSPSETGPTCPIPSLPLDKHKIRVKRKKGIFTFFPQAIKIFLELVFSENSALSGSTQDLGPLHKGH